MQFNNLKGWDLVKLQIISAVLFTKWIIMQLFMKTLSSKKNILKIL